MVSELGIKERERTIILQRLASSIYEAAGHDGSDLLILIVKSMRDGEGSRIVRCYQGVSPELYQLLLSARSATAFFQQAIWERFPPVPVNSAVSEAVDKFFAMQPEGTIRLAPAPRSDRSASHPRGK